MIAFLIDFIPVLLFFIAFKLYGIYVATTVGIIVTALAVVIYGIWKRQVNKQQLITLFVFVVFGGMTLYFHNPLFVKWKPSIVFWVFALVLLVSQFIGKKPLIQRMMQKTVDEKFHVPEMIWRKLNIAWMVFFTVMGMINLFVAYTYTTDTWVNFKLYGILGLFLLFSLGQAFFLLKHAKEESAHQNESR